jgi:hypothetical protein
MGGTKLQQKIKNPAYYSTNKRLQGHVTEMLGILSNINGFVPRQNEKYIIWERLPPKITKYYEKVLIIFHNSNKRRTIEIFFPENDILNIYLSSQVYDDPLTSYFKEKEKYTQTTFTNTDLEYRLNVFNRYNNTEEKFTLDTTIGTMIDCYMNSPDIIALWLSFYPKLDIITLLFKNNESDGYISVVVESNIPKDNNDKSKKDSIFLLTMKSNSNIKSTFSLSSTSKFNSNFHSSTPYIFKKNVINYENVNNKELENLQKRLKELKSLNLKDQHTITKIRKTINCMKK